MIFRSLSAILSFVFLVVSCAHQITPTGGPDDRTGPTVQSTEPAPGSVKVDPRSRCAITFSEWLSKATAQKSVSILPSLDGGVKIRVSGKRLEITPNKTFADSTTYHIIITGTLQDLHANPLARSYTLVFSTGPSLDSGKIIGCVIDPSRRLFQPTVALFRAQRAEHDSVMFTEPDYLTQADSAAFFSIENVRPGNYRLIAFTDKNSNHRLNPGTEDAYAPLSPFITVTPLADTTRLFPVESDTAAPHLASIKPCSPKIITGKLDRPLDIALGCSEPQWAVECIGDTCASPAVSGLCWLGNRARFALLLAGALSNAPYRAICTYKKKKDTSFVVVSDTVRFNGLTIDDTVPPALVSRPPAGTVPLEPEIQLNFSEPVALKGLLFLADSLRDTVRLGLDTGYADTTLLTPKRRLHPGSCYRLVLLTKNGCDIAGNLLKARDSTDTVAAFRFTVIAADSLAVSLSGCAPFPTPAPKRKWRFIPLSRGKETLCPDSGGCFRFNSIPYGKGNIGCFIDENGNNRPDAGSLVPWIAPEPSFVFPDTVEARARWEIEGVTFAGQCGKCAPHKAASVQPVVPGKSTKTGNKKNQQ
jgi:hypothetical protein